MCRGQTRGRVITAAGVTRASANRGYTIDCGCSGTDDRDATVTRRHDAIEVTRDTGFLAHAARLVVYPRTPASLGHRSRRFVGSGACAEVDGVEVADIEARPNGHLTRTESNDQKEKV